MIDVLGALDYQLRPLLARYGFAPAHPGPSITEEDAEAIRLLEYRCSRERRPSLRLDVCQIMATSTISAELWSPADLVRVLADTTVDDVAIGRRVWRTDSARDPHTLVGTIVATIVTWCDERRPRRSKR